MIDNTGNVTGRIRTSITKTRHAIQSKAHCNGVGGDPWYVLLARVLWPVHQAVSIEQQIKQGVKLTQR